MLLSVTVSYNFFRSRKYTDYVNKVGVYRVSPAYGVRGNDPGEAAGTPHNHNFFISYHAGKLPANSSLDLIVYDHHFQSLNRYEEKSSSWPGWTG